MYLYLIALAIMSNPDTHLLFLFVVHQFHVQAIFLCLGLLTRCLLLDHHFVTLQICDFHQLKTFLQT